MNARHLILTTLLLASGCGVEPSNFCETTCAGCCRDGLCLAGSDSLACGAAGGACDICVQNQACVSGRCRASPAATDAGACVPLTEASLCLGASRECGSLLVVDPCGASRSVASCGTCSSNAVCSNGACVCMPETASAICQRLGRRCGTATTTDNCGASRTVSCGSCPDFTTCGGGGSPTTCGCTPETNLEFCARLGSSCGAVQAVNDNCGVPRTVASCGACVSPNTCSSGHCTCIGENDSQFCARLGATCGQLTGVDACGQTRNVASCGSCSGASTCGGGGTSNHCGCTPQTDAALCAAQNKDCGTMTVTDCTSRTISCGTCGGLTTCGGGGTANLCGCTTESDTAFCTRLGAQCGAVTAPDNCGAQRSVASCGVCTSPGLCTASNRCVCTPESDAAMCSRLGKTCGAVTAADNCGSSRTIASCGACGSGSCSLTNVCLPATPLPNGVCTTDGFCWVQPTNGFDTYRGVAVEPSGVTWAVGVAGSVVRWDGSTVRGWRHLRDATFNAVWAGSSTDVWVGGTDGLVMHFNGTSWEDVSFPTGSDVLTIWGDGSGTIYIGGENGLVQRWSNGTWSAPFLLPGDAVFQLSGYGSGVRITTSRRHSEWRTNGTVVEIGARIWGCAYASHVTVSSSEVWGVRRCGLDTSSGYTEAFQTVGNSLSWASLPGAETTGAAHFAARSASDIWLFGSSDHGWHFNGLVWAPSAISPSPTQLYAGNGSAARAAFAGTRGSIFGIADAGWVSATPDAGFPAEVSGPISMNVVPISDSSAVTTISGESTRVLSIWREGTWVGTRSFPSSEDLVGAWSGDGTTAFALTHRPNEAASLWRFDGANWSLVGALPAHWSYDSISGSSNTDLWISGSGVLVRYDGTTFTSVPNPYSGSYTYLNHLMAVSPSLAFVRAADGRLLKWDGTSWAVDTAVGTTTSDQPMWKSQQGSVYVKSSLGLRKYANGAWSTLPRPPGRYLGASIFGSTDSDVWVSAILPPAVKENELCRWNGSAWTCADSPVGLFIGQRVVQTGARQWLVRKNSAAPTSSILLRR